MAEGKIDPTLALRSEGRLLARPRPRQVARGRRRPWQHHRRPRPVGFSYKAAWDAVNAINNLLPTPAFVTKAGGRSGGGAEVTEEGRRLIATFHRLEEKLARISETIAEEGLAGAEDFLLWTTGMTISARNVFRAEVSSGQEVAGRCRSDAAGVGKGYDPGDRYQ